MIIFDSDEDIKFLNDIWDNNNGKYYKYFHKMKDRIVIDKSNTTLLKFEKKNSRRNVNQSYSREPYFPVKKSNRNL